jgi:hypothetical protein
MRRLQLLPRAHKGQESNKKRSLTNIPAAQITVIRLYRVSDANAKYGSHDLSGVIAITTWQ